MKTSQKNLDQPVNQDKKFGKKSDASQLRTEKQPWTVTPPTVDENLPPSKTKLKEEADAQQALGVRLTELSKEKLLKLNLPEDVLDAVLESKKITANGAIRRHRQYLGRLMREMDTQSIEEQLEKWDGKNIEENAKFHGMERWRTRLLTDANAIEAFLNTFPQADSQQIRALIRNAQREHTANKPPKSSRELFKKIRELHEMGSFSEDESD